MKRNWELVKDLLSEVEAETLKAYIKEGKFKQDHYTFDEVLGHLEILCHAGIIAGGEVRRSVNGSIADWDFRGAFITMQGHDLLDCLRDRPVWERLKDKANKAGVAISWEFLKAAIPIVMADIAKRF